MGIGTGILNALGRSPDTQYRSECEALGRGLFSDAPIDTVNEVFGLFSHGGAIEVLMTRGFTRVDAEGGAHEIVYEMRKMFNSAKTDGPGSPSDQSARAMARTIATATARRGPIVLVAGLSEVFKEIRNRNYVLEGLDLNKLYEESTLKALSRSQYLRDECDKMS